MSGPLAIAATTAALRELLRAGMMDLGLSTPLGGDVNVSVSAPDRVAREPPGAVSQLNLFLYNVTRNTGWTANGLPARDWRGERLANPVLGLDLYYLLTAYGVADYDAEILLGGAIQVLHDTPGMIRDTIRAALTPSPTRPAVLAQLQSAGLAEQIEHLKISPVPMLTDEISRLWPSLDTPYRTSVAYMVTVVLLESGQSTPEFTLPVRERGIYVVPFRELRIDRVVNAAGDNVPISRSSTIRIIGRQLGSTDVRVMVNGPELPDGVDMTSGIVLRTNEEIRFTLLLPQLLPQPPALPPAIRAGICGLQLVQPIAMGRPPTAHEGVASNVASFVLTPEITPTVAAGALDIACAPPVGIRQRVRLLLNQHNAPIGAVARAYSFPAPANNGIVPPATETSVVTVPLSGIVAGDYLVRLQVDGAESGLTVDGLGRYDQPRVPL